MLDFLNLLGAIESGPGRRIAADDVNGLVVSTVVTHDLGPETALCDENGTHPVERYATEAAAKAGHKAWVKKAKTLKTVKKLGYGTSIPDVRITLKRTK